MSSSFIKEEDVEREDGQYTFSPEISPLAKTIIHREPMEHRARNVLLEREQNLKKLAENIEHNSRRDSPFKPSITPYEFKSNRQGFMKSLEHESERRKVNLQRLEEQIQRQQQEEATFKPEISEYSSSLQRDEPVFDRLYNSTLEKDEEAQLNEKPQTLVYPSLSTMKNSSHRDGRVDQYLYDDAKRREERQKREIEAEKERIKEENRLKLNGRSKTMVIGKFEKSLGEAFDEYDPTAPRKFADFTRITMILQLIGAIKNVEPLPQQDREILESIWRILDSHQTGFVKKERFIRIMREIVYPSSSKSLQGCISRNIRAEIKTRLIASGRQRKKKVSTEEHSFAPRINERSKKMATRKIESKTGNENDLDALAKNINDLEIDSNSGPQISNRSSTQVTPHYERLFKSYKDKEGKIQREKRQTELREMEECTFAPKINSKYKVKRKSGEKKSHFEKLYEQRKKERPAGDVSSVEEKQLEECTFKPKTSKHVRKSPSSPKQNQNGQKLPAGYSAAIKRLRNASKIRKEHESQKFYASLRSSENSEGSPGENQPNHQTFVKPFDFELEKRKRSKPLMYLDVNLGPGKTGRIGIHKGDDPAEVAKNFSISYRLDESTTQRLESMIRSTLENTFPSETSEPISVQYDGQNYIQESPPKDAWEELFGNSENFPLQSTKDNDGNDGDKIDEKNLEQVHNEDSVSLDNFFNQQVSEQKETEHKTNNDDESTPTTVFDFF
eukprot:gb/GECH01012840.1/.p1 GENE.gb/GECH01012840.1/~~gb/GECH01012840.1/.p1  ORF type:complete len:730 (+),score=182.83 gb/GECH01012840.1/:1-2190(+)